MPVVYSDSEQCAPCPPCVCPGEADEAAHDDPSAGATFQTAMPAAHTALRRMYGSSSIDATKLRELAAAAPPKATPSPMDVALCGGIAVIVLPSSSHPA